MGSEMCIRDRVEAISTHNDPRLREYLAVIGFYFGEFYFAAINISRDGSQDGDLYTTIPDEVASSSPIGSANVTWSEIARFADRPHVVTSWTHFE